MHKLFYVLGLSLLYSTGVHSANVEDKVVQYFKSDVFKHFQKHWQAHRRSFENAIVLALKENYGHRGMNIFVRRSADVLNIANGLLIDDSVINLLLLDLTLTEIPHLTMPEVTFALASNALSLVAGLRKMIVNTRYVLFRNHTQMLYAGVDQHPYKYSPFSFEQVQMVGQLTIIAEECNIAGYVLTQLIGQSINLGHNTFRVRGCSFSVEISPYHLEAPPVIAPYFSREQREQLEILLTKPILEELLPKLQAAVFTYVNTSMVFGDYLTKFRQYQNNIFKDASKYMADIARGIANKAIEMNEVTKSLEPIDINWSVETRGGIGNNLIMVYNTTLHGLDTLYSSHSGGPYQLKSSRISEAWRFNRILVRGTLIYENNTRNQHEFVGEMHDLNVNVEIEPGNQDPTFEVLSWRDLELSAIRPEDLKYRRILTAFVHGYLMNSLPEVIKDHLSNLYQLLKNKAESVTEKKC